jgi:hypothetical protein
MCHADHQRTEALLLVLLGVLIASRKDLLASVAELVYSEPLIFLGELLTPTTDPVEPAHLITHLCQHMAHLTPVPAERHASQGTFVHKGLHLFMHVFLRQDVNRWALDVRYSGPYEILSRRQRTMQLLVRGKPVTVLADRVKPAYKLNETDCRNTTFNANAATFPVTAPPTPPPPPLAPRLLLCTLQKLSKHLREGGWGGGG